MEEHVVVDRTTTWSRIGRNVSGCKNMEEVLVASEMDYTVEKYPIFTKIGGPFSKEEVIPNRFITARNDRTKMYDVVSDKFEVIQNRDAFDFVRYMGEELTFDKAGETANGMVYIIGSLPEVNILGDSFIPHVIFRNGFSGKVKITAAICPLRMVCQNQFNFAFKRAQNTVTIRHVRNAEVKLQEAREVLKVCADYMQTLNAEAERYAGIKMSNKQFDNVLEHLFPMKNADTMNSFKRHQLEKARDKLKSAYAAGDNANFHGTAWGMINAYTDFITHKEAMGKNSTKEEGKFMAVTFNPAMMNGVINAMEAVGITA